MQATATAASCRTSSELIKARPSKKVTDWLASVQEPFLALSVLTLGELEKGIAKLPAGGKKEKIQKWFEGELPIRFDGRIHPIDQPVALRWGQISGEAEKKGQKLTVIDSLLAATALVHGLTVVTRDAEHIGKCGASIHNPWQ